MLELDFGDTPEKLKEEYLDIYDNTNNEIYIAPYTGDTISKMLYISMEMSRR